MPSTPLLRLAAAQPCALMEIQPTPTDEEAAAIAAAIEVSWPRPVAAPVDEPPPRWRFAGRWWTKPIPIRRDRPW
ncbi:MAG: hypothetical protein ABWZ52_10000 [Acidimicrobiales bacterium]